MVTSGQHDQLIILVFITMTAMINMLINVIQTDDFTLIIMDN